MIGIYSVLNLNRVQTVNKPLFPPENRGLLTV